MKQIAITMTAAMLLATLGSAVIYPSAIDEYSEGEHLRIEKTYILADEEDVSLVPTADFEREGCRYTLIDIVCRHDTDTDTKPHRETVTVEASSASVEDARSLFEDVMTARTEDGYSGELHLDEESIAVSPSGYGIITRAVSATRSYPSLSDADTSLIPKSIDEDVVEEIRAPQGYAISDAPKTVYLSGDEQAVVTVEFADEPDSGLIVLKLDSDTRKPLASAVFEIRSSDGAVVGTSDGRYTTDASGRIHLPNLPADTYIVREVQAPRGYSADSETQTVLLEHGKTHTLTFYNTRIPEGGLRVLKLDEHTGQPIEGVRFTIYHMDGRTVGSYRTNRSGIISLDGLTPGWYTAVETRAADGYELDATPHGIEVKAGETAMLEVTNSRTSSIIIRKVDSTTGARLSGATFVLYDSHDNPIGEYRSDQRGYVYIDGLEDGKYSLREIEAPSGYVIDSERKTVYVRYGASSEVRWENTPMSGQIQIVKRSADYCETTGLPAGSPLEGAVFEVYDERTGNFADTVRSGANGLAVTKQLPLGRYVVRETTAPNGYLANGATVTAVIEYSGQIVRLEVENESVRTGVEIVKTSAKEIVSGQPVRYVIRSIANTSNVALDSFYWRDTLPFGITPERLVTGRYDGSGSYKVMYRVEDGEYRVLADNLSRERSYTLSLFPATLGLAADERITEIMLVFGRVPSGFHATETPMIYAIARG